MSLRSRALVLISAVLASATSGVVVVSSVTHAATDQAMVLIHQDLALPADGNLDVTVRLAEALTANERVRVTAYQQIDTRQQLAQTIAEDPGQFFDSVDLDDSSITANENGTITLHIATESLNRTAAALQFPTAGLYPVVIDVLRDDSAVAAEMLTFVDRQASAVASETEPAPAPLGSLNVAVIASVTAPPAIPGGSTALPADAAASVLQLAGYATMSQLVRPSVSMSPEILTANRIDEATLGQVLTVMQQGLVLSQPQIPFDPSSATASGQVDRFIQLLREGENGENAIIAGVEAPAAQRVVWVSPSAITTEGASTLRDLGFRVLVINADAYKTAVGNKYGFSDFSQLFHVNLPDDTVMPMGVIDPVLNDGLVDGRWERSPEQAALYVAADLVAWRDQLARQSTPVSGHTVLFGLSNGGVPDPAKVQRIAEMATGTGAATFTAGLNNYETDTHYQLIDGVPINVTLTAPPPLDLNVRKSTLDLLTLGSHAVSSMLVTDLGRPARWQQTIETLWSTSLTDHDVQVNATALQAELDAITSAVVPTQGYSFSLSGRRATVPIRIANESSEQLRVVVQLSAAADKIQFPQDLPPAILEPNMVNLVKVPVVARTNGSFDVRLDIVTPLGEMPVADTTTLRANVNTLTGLAQVLTGAGLLILATWWVRNIRRSRRERRGLVAKNGHPSVRPEPLALNGESPAAVSSNGDVTTVPAAHPQPRDIPSATLSDS